MDSQKITFTRDSKTHCVNQVFYNGDEKVEIVTQTTVTTTVTKTRKRPQGIPYQLKSNVNRGGYSELPSTNNWPEISEGVSFPTNNSQHQPLANSVPSPTRIYQNQGFRNFKSAPHRKQVSSLDKENNYGKVPILGNRRCRDRCTCCALKIDNNRKPNKISKQPTGFGLSTNKKESATDVSVYDFIDENEEIMLPSAFRRQIVSENNFERVGVLIKKDKKNNYISNLL